ncbi:TniB family NTP-binding protein [Streptomyces abikoensis]|uniref:TniB family NTP-binding protein n=1 Tax=Streptomyces abikoensis TaxID=97398 RepID=UPI003F4D304C
MQQRAAPPRHRPLPRRARLPPCPRPEPAATDRIRARTGTSRLRPGPARCERESPRRQVRPLPRHPPQHPHDPGPDHDTVCHTYNQAGVRLLLIDEIHRLNPGTTSAETADLLKDLTERIQATFVYAGIDVTATPLLTGVRGEQLAARASLVDWAPFPARDGMHEPFRNLVRALENALDLRHHRPGNLVRLAPYLARPHRQTHRQPHPPHPAQPCRGRSLEYGRFRSAPATASSTTPRRARRRTSDRRRPSHASRSGACSGVAVGSWADSP